MENLLVKPACAVSAGLLRGLLVIGVVAGLLVALARLSGLDVPPNVIVGLISFFLAGAMLVSHGLSILRKPGVILLVGVVLIGGFMRFQDSILKLL